MKAQMGPAGTMQAVKEEETSRYEDLGYHLRDLDNQSVHEAPFRPVDLIGSMQRLPAFLCVD